MRRAWAGLATAAMMAILPAAAQKGHVHGAATLDVSVEGTRLSLAFAASLEDVVGFERAPRDERERAAIEAMKGHLASGRAFAPNGEARCRAVESRADITTPGQGHAAVEASFAFHCDAAVRLAHVEAALFERYPRLKRIDARVVSAKGQSAARLTPTKRRLPL